MSSTRSDHPRAQARAGAGEADRRFFVPGEKPGKAQEREYDRLCDAARDDTQREPRTRRIFSVGCRHEGRDCHFQVGAPDPVSGDEIVAIIDVGGTEPFNVYTVADGTERCLRLGKHVYAVTEFS